MTGPFQQLTRLADPHARLVRTWELAGGVSAQVTAFEIERRDGETAKLLARRHGERDLAGNPNIARDEFRLLEIAHAHGLAVPKPYYVDESCAIFPTPVLVVEYVEGETELAPPDLHDFLAQVAGQLVRIHAVPDSPELSFLPRLGNGFGARPAVLDESMGESRIRDVLEAAWPLAQVNNPVLLHGDYWPGNILWRNGRIAAVIDWEDAHVGDPLADLGNCRLETLWAFGADAMRQFTDLYLSLSSIDPVNLPYWDLVAALRPCGHLAGWGLDSATEARMKAQHRAFVDQAVEAIHPVDPA